MKKFKKLSTGIACALCLMSSASAINAMPVNAMPINNESNQVVAQEDASYYDGLYSKEAGRYALNENGEDVTDYFIDHTRSMYSIGDVDGIRNFMADNNIVLHNVTVEMVNSGISAYGLTTFKSVTSDLLDFTIKDSTGRVSLYVQAELKGGLWYDKGTGKVTSVSKPTYNILGTEMNGSFYVSSNNFSTGSSVSGGQGYFWGQCSFTAQEQTGNPSSGITKLYFGPKRVSFYARP